MRTYFYGETTIENNQCLARNFWVFWSLDQEKAWRESYKLDIRQSLNYFFYILIWFLYFYIFRYSAHTGDIVALQRCKIFPKNFLTVGDYTAKVGHSDQKGYKIDASNFW